MIARVRIAPVEQWCEWSRQALIVFGCDPQRIVGMEVEIDTAKMEPMGRLHYSDGMREEVAIWPLTIESCNKLRGAYGLSPNYSNVWICAHQLEMD